MSRNHNSTPFDIEKAKAGAAVKTRSGTPARIVCFDAVGPEPLVVLHKEDDEDMRETVSQHSADGMFNKERGETSLDLVMA